MDYAQRQAVAAAIEAVRASLVDAVLTDLYRNPFWDDRYGERGRQFARQDINYHLDFLIAAIRVDSLPTLTDYYRWVQALLIPRGMCTQHIRQNLERLAYHLQQLAPEAWPAMAP